MRALPFLILIALAGCNRQAANIQGNVVNIVAEEGIEDVNSSIEGDQLSPDLEAVDDMARNGSLNATAAPGK